MNENSVSGNGSVAGYKPNAIQDGIAHAPGGGDALLRLDDVVMLLLDHHPRSNDQSRGKNSNTRKE